MHKVKTPPYPKGLIKNFGKALSNVTELQLLIFKNQVIEKAAINKINLRKNYSNEFLNLSKNVGGDLKKRFSDERIKRILETYLSKVNYINANIFYKRLSTKTNVETLS